MYSACLDETRLTMKIKFVPSKTTAVSVSKITVKNFKGQTRSRQLVGKSK